MPNAKVQREKPIAEEKKKTEYRIQEPEASIRRQKPNHESTPVEESVLPWEINGAGEIWTTRKGVLDTDEHGFVGFRNIRTDPW